MASNTPLGLWSEILHDIHVGELEQHPDELDAYLAQLRAYIEEDMLRWWANYEAWFPILAGTARDFLRVPAISAPSKRAFSLGKEVISTFIHDLELATIEKIMLLKTWLGHVDF